MSEFTGSHTRPSHYVRIDETLCNGCVLCMKACPTKAIRVRGGRVAQIEGSCIDCGECIRVCPRGAIRAVTTGSDANRLGHYTIISASPVLYTQFGEDVTPNEVLLALRKKFRFVYDQTQTHELCNVATELYIRENRAKEGSPWPLISNVCPVVNRLIAYRFPALLKHIIPITPPREIAARQLKRRLYAEIPVKPGEVAVYHVTPCSAKMISVKEPMFLEASYIDGVLGINEVYDVVEKNIRDVEEDILIHCSSGMGIGWGVSGGEIAGMGPGNYLAVSGLQETIRYLVKIEMGYIGDIDYIEFRACGEGCIGGPLTVADKYQAKSTLARLVRMFGVEKRIRISHVEKAYKEGLFFSDGIQRTLETKRKHLSIADAIKRQERIEEVLNMLPRKECGACGCPDCVTFAEDVVDGKDSLQSCLFWKDQKKKLKSNPDEAPRASRS